jgi:hypothetical protein
MPELDGYVDEANGAYGVLNEEGWSFLSTAGTRLMSSHRTDFLEAATSDGYYDGFHDMALVGRTITSEEEMDTLRDLEGDFSAGCVQVEYPGAAQPIEFIKFTRDDGSEGCAWVPCEEPPDPGEDGIVVTEVRIRPHLREGFGGRLRIARDGKLEETSRKTEFCPFFPSKKSKAEGYYKKFPDLLRGFLKTFRNKAVWHKVWGECKLLSYDVANDRWLLLVPMGPRRWVQKKVSGVVAKDFLRSDGPWK